jgi:simple sugar transport system permease protein/D-ribose pyranase
MKRNGILNLPLNEAIAAMGHGDLLIVCDAGFPIPSQIPRVDLAILPDLPDLQTVLSAIAQDFIAEKVSYAAEMAENNPELKRKVDQIFVGADFIAVSHQQILSELSHKAKFIVRTGAFDPWGNILLYSGVDVPKWFTKPGTVAPEYYARKLAQYSGAKTNDR